MTVRILTGDCRVLLPTLDAGSVHTCVTSPPFWLQRDYGVAGQTGLEETVDDHIAELVRVFREVRRVLRPDGTLWVNLGDSFAGSQSGPRGESTDVAYPGKAAHPGRVKRVRGLRRKELIGLPWRIAFALQADGWRLRLDVIWEKTNAMPEAVKDRPTRTHDYVFLFSKSHSYYYDEAAIREPTTGGAHSRGRGVNPKARRGAEGRQNASFAAAVSGLVSTRNARSVWRIATSNVFRCEHRATFPPEFARRCVLAGSPVGGVVLDPFAGTGTVGEAAALHGRSATLIELSDASVAEMRRRFETRAPLLAREAAE